MAYVRAVSNTGRDVERAGPFLATFAHGTASPHLNYAIPDDGAEPSVADVEALVALFERRGLQPRLEFIPTVAPRARGVLEADGFAVQHHLPLMTVEPATVRELALPDGLTLLRPSTDAELLAMAVMQGEAFGEPLLEGDAALVRRRGSLDAGALLLCALDENGNVAGSAMCAPAHAGITEIVGVAVTRELRRRGVAGALVSQCARDSFAGGVSLAFLEAAQGADGAYRRAGFQTASSVINYAR